jgi:hypothetical protein
MMPFVLLLVVFFSGCDLLGGGPRTGAVDEVVRGDGLRIDFKLDSRGLSFGGVRYEITFHNTGRDPVTITRDTLRLTTIEQAGPIGTGVFTSESLSAFYDSIFRHGEVVVHQGQKIGPISGTLYIIDDFFNSIAYDSFTSVLEFSYPYKTYLRNNLEIDLGGTGLLKVMDTLSQAAPLKVTSINLQQKSLSEFAIEYTLEDRGLYANQQQSVSVDNHSLSFRNQSLNNCKYYVEDDWGRKEIARVVITRNTPQVQVSCPVSFSDEDKEHVFTTFTSGEFEYIYSITVVNNVRFRD